jgi:hypothetical protein
MKKIKFEERVVDGVENISVQALPGDRIIFEPIKVTPKSVSEVIDPATNKPFEKPDWDRWPIRGVVRHAGADIEEKFPAIKTGTTIFLEDINAIRGIDINGKHYGLTRLSNVLLVYNENN